MVVFRQIYQKDMLMIGIFLDLVSILMIDFIRGLRYN